MDLDNLGWEPYFEQHFKGHKDAGLIPARIAQEHKLNYMVFCAIGELKARVSGRFQHEARGLFDFPSVGDWVAIAPLVNEKKATIHARLPRKSSFSRKVKGAATEEQIVAANIDTLLIVSGLDHDFNIRRIERYLTLAWDSGAAPVLVLNKVDLCPDIHTRITKVRMIAFDTPIHPVSAIENRGLDQLQTHFRQGKTAALVGSSGVGKSTIINSLLGKERQITKDVRASDGRGRHATTMRELILLPAGGIIIDNPGMRELQLWADEDSLTSSFGDVEELAANCHFSDCSHSREPGCAVQAAIENGDLGPARFQSYLKLQKELKHLATKQDWKAREEERQKWRKIAMASRQLKKNKKKDRQ
jgi:ribosome biogenesis GTPase